MSWHRFLGAGKRDIAAVVLRQRTGLRRISRSPYMMKLLPEKYLIALDATLFCPFVMRGYRASVRQDWDMIAPHIPDHIRNSLDIGCGVGGINEFIYGQFGSMNLDRITLADRDEVADVMRYGMSADPSACNSLDLSVEYLVSVGVPRAAINTVDLNTTSLPEGETFDLIISLISLGFHYPVTVYLDYLVDHLADNGVAIMDCRQGTDGIDLLEEHFNVRAIDDGASAKWTRVACARR